MIVEISFVLAVKSRAVKPCAALLKTIPYPPFSVLGPQLIKLKHKGPDQKYEAELYSLKLDFSQSSSAQH